MLPTLIQIGSISVNSYGVFTLLGFLVGVFFADFYAKSVGINRQRVFIGAIWGFSALWIGTRIGNAFLIWTAADQGFSLWDNLVSPSAGFAEQGGILAIVLFVVFYFRYHQISAAKALDIFTYACAAAASIGRWGCLFAGCCYGKPTNAPWGINLALRPELGKIHPTQAYHAIGFLFIFLALNLVKSKKPKPGVIASSFFIAYGILRFTIEFWRDDPSRGRMIIELFSMPQIISLISLAAGAVSLCLILRRSFPSAFQKKSLA